LSNIGLQMYSLKKYTEKDFLGTLKKVSEIGFNAVEFAGFFNIPAKELKKYLNDLQIVPCGSHTSLELFTNNFSETMEYNLEIGNKYVYCPSLPSELIKDEAGFKKASEIFNEIGLKCKKLGLEFGYHNHAFEFEKINNTYGYEILINNTQEDLVKLQIDTFWVEYAGYNPIELMEKNKNRLSLLHLKEMKDRNSKIDTSAGYGISKTEAIIKKAKQLDIKYIIIEQEHFESDNHYEGVKKGLEYIKTIIWLNNLF